MDTITVIIEKGTDGGFTAYSEQVPGVYANGLTEDEVRQEFAEMMSEQAAYMEERTGERPAWQGADIRYVYSLSALFEAYPFLNASALAEWMGINSSVMRRYKAGLSSPRGKHKAVMQAKIQELSSRLAQVHL